ncbi:blast:Protein vreteno [Drosophila guanche]|nr:blast:Protein vreteno [Drosophila guanche]
MRRSQAPSVRRAAKRGYQEVAQQEEPPADWPAATPTTMEWGTAKGYESVGPREIKPGENPLKEGRIFHVLWRNQTTKKHKIWTGNGTLVIAESKATLKDDTGKVVDSMTCFRQRNFKENDQLQVGSKDVELQDEFKTVEECIEYRKLEIANWCAKIDAVNGHIETPTPPRDSSKTCSVSDPPVNPPLRTSLLKKCNAPATTCTQIEYMCFLQPAELQAKALQLLRELSQRSDMEPILLAELAKHICDHPVLLKTRVGELQNCEAMQLLLLQLPPWQEMGPDDSAKFEFVSLMLDDFALAGSHKICVLANSQNCLELFRGYCRSYDIPHVQLENASDVALFNSTEDQSERVALVLASRSSEIRYLRCKYLIIYNYDASSGAEQLLAGREMDTKVYTLITSSGCSEELEFYKSLELVPGGATNALANWLKVEPPYSQEFLEDASISVNLESLSNICIKKNVK